jgi:hypothetical protein
MEEQKMIRGGKELVAQMAKGPKGWFLTVRHPGDPRRRTYYALHENVKGSTAEPIPVSEGAYNLAMKKGLLKHHHSTYLPTTGIRDRSYYILAKTED